MVWDLKTRESKRTIPVYEVKSHFVSLFEILCSPQITVPVYCEIRFLSLVLSRDLITVCPKLVLFCLSLFGVFMPGYFKEIHVTAASSAVREGRTVMAELCSLVISSRAQSGQRTVGCVCGGCAALAQLWLLKCGSGPLRSAGVCPTLAERGSCHFVT